MHKLVVFLAALAACAPYKPVSKDAGSSTDASSSDAAKEASACVVDGQPCNGSVPCCLGSSVCNPATLVCQKACMGVGSVCSSNGECCSGICSGTCE